MPDTFDLGKSTYWDSCAPISIAEVVFHGDLHDFDVVGGKVIHDSTKYLHWKVAQTVVLTIDTASNVKPRACPNSSSLDQRLNAFDVGGIWLDNKLR